MDSLFLSECVDCGDSLSVSVRDVCGSSDAAIPVAITEGEERAVARALGVRAGKTRLRRKWGAVPYVTRADATAGDFLMCRSDVGDNQCAHGRTRRRRSH